MIEEKKKERRGGRRESSGRKKVGVKRIVFRAPQDIVDILDTKENMTEFICTAIRELKTNEII